MINKSWGGVAVAACLCLIVGDAKNDTITLHGKKLHPGETVFVGNDDYSSTPSSQNQKGPDPGCLFFWFILIK